MLSVPDRVLLLAGFLFLLLCAFALGLFLGCL